MGEISDEILFGIITHVDDRFNYVWNDKLGSMELRFPINQAAKLEHGDIVRYIQRFDARSVQAVHNVKLVRPQIQRKHELVRSDGGKIKWMIKVPITFAPEESDQFRQLIYKDDGQLVKAVAYNYDFKLVVTFVEGVLFDLGRVYMAWITRIPRAHDPVAKKIDSIFCILGKDSLELATDQQLINETMEHCPWKHKDGLI